MGSLQDALNERETELLECKSRLQDLLRMYEELERSSIAKDDGRMTQIRKLLDELEKTEKEMISQRDTYEASLSAAADKFVEAQKAAQEDQNRLNRYWAAEVQVQENAVREAQETQREAEIAKEAAVASAREAESVMRRSHEREIAEAQRRVETAEEKARNARQTRDSHRDEEIAQYESFVTRLNSRISSLEDALAEGENTCCECCGIATD